MPKLRELLREAAGRLAEAGVETPRVDAELLAAHVLGVARGRLILVDDVEPEAAERLEELLRRRERREPLQHLTGTAPFLGLELAVGPGVFIPRPETELLARWGSDALRGLESPIVVDLCSGSGALALAISAEHPGATVYAVELSSRATSWLNRNVSGSAVKPVFGDAASPATLSEVDGLCDLVVTNPPYVPRWVEVAAEVAAHDPDEAVFGGADGLELIGPLIERAAGLLKPGGRLGMEHDESHDGEVRELMKAHFREIATHRDLADRPRYTTAVRGA